MISRISERIEASLNKVFGDKLVSEENLEWEVTSAIKHNLTFEDGTPTVNTEHIMLVVLILNEPGQDPIGMTCAFLFNQLTDEYLEHTFTHLSDEIAVARMERSFYAVEEPPEGTPKGVGFDIDSIEDIPD